MITTFAMYDVTVSSWLIYAFSSMLADPFYALTILCVTTVVLFFIIGKLWGLAWNKKWDFSGNRFLVVGAISLLGGLSLAAVNGLYGGKFFQMEVAEAMAAIQADGKVEYDDLKSPEYDDYSAARKIIDKVQPYVAETEEEKLALQTGNPILVVLDDKVVAPYFTALYMLWSVFGTVLAGLIAGVAWFSYKDIKECEPY